MEHCWTKAETFISVTGWAGFLICMPEPYIIDTVDLEPALGELFVQARGSHYMHSVPGNYFIVLRGVGADGVSFTVESHH